MPRKPCALMLAMVDGTMSGWPQDVSSGMASMVFPMLYPGFSAAAKADADTSWKVVLQVVAARAVRAAKTMGRTATARKIARGLMAVVVSLKLATISLQDRRGKLHGQHPDLI